MKRFLIFFIVIFMLLTGNILSNGLNIPYQIASWYDYTHKGKQVTKHYNTCATRDFPRNSYVKVKNIINNKSVICKVTDYLEHPNRNIDLSSKAFKSIANLDHGLIYVNITKI